MDKFLTFPGTQPVYLGDVDFMQASAANTFKQLARALMNSGSNSFNAILQGVEITRNGDNVTFSPGIVVINAEILPFEGATLTSSPSYYFHVASTLSGERTFKNGESHDCYETRKAVINTTSLGGIEVDSCERLHQSVEVTTAPSDRSGFIGGASLFVRANVCYMEFDYTATPGGGTDATVDFVVDYALAQALNGIAIPASAISIFLGGQEIQPFMINLSGVQNTLRFSISCQWASENGGSGRCYVSIPLVFFNS